MTPYKLTSTPNHSTQKISPARLLDFGIILGIVLIVLAIAWAGVLRGQDWLDSWFAIESLAFVADMGLGLLMGAGFSLLVWWAVGQRLLGLKKIRDQLVAMIDMQKMRLWHIAAISFWAAVPEEIFFRGAMQPATSLVFTALIFGSLHAMTPAYFGYAVLAGFGLGLLAEWQDNLWMAIAAHFGVDFVSLLLLMLWARRQQSNEGLDINLHPMPHLEAFD